MKLLDLHIDGFGKFHNLSISFKDGLNVIYGKNEAGKSTLHTFIRGMLFGIERARGRASKNDIYTRFEPWENSGTYEGHLRLEHEGTVYRIERSFQKNNKDLTIVNETLGKEVEPTKALMDELLNGLSETAYNNTISIGQLKSATDGGMVSELKNYIANLNTSGNMALNITKASAFLKEQRKSLASQMVPEAARSYASVLGEIRNIEKEISAPEYENQLPAFQKMKNEVQELISSKQEEKEELLQKIARGKQVLSTHQFTDCESIAAYEANTESIYRNYLEAEKKTGSKSRKVVNGAAVLLGIMFLALGGYLFAAGNANFLTSSFGIPYAPVSAASLMAAAVLFICRAILFMRDKHYQKDLTLYSTLLQEIYSRHLGDSSITEQAIQVFKERMAEFKRLYEAVLKSEAAVAQLTNDISELQLKQTSCSQFIEQQQRNQWELEKKLEHLTSCKNQAATLKHVLEENERLQQELSAIDLAQETMTELSTSIRDSFGLYLNKTASELIDGITGGIYNSMSIDENLNVFMNTKTRLVPIEQVSSGTMDQIYLALRLATAKLIQNGRTEMPLIFDDSFVLYDDERLRTALKWLLSAYQGQIIMFTCHQREAQMMTANQIPYHLIKL